jgi:MFS family permease
MIHKAAIGPGSVLALGMMGYVGFSTFVPLYVSRFPGVDASGVFLIYAAVVLIVRLGGARIPDRFGAGPVASVALVLIMIGLAVVASVASPAGLYTGTAVMAVGVSLQYPALISLAVGRVDAHDRGAVLGTFTSFFDLSNGLGGVIMGGVAQFAGYRGAFAAGAGLALVAFVLHRTKLAGTTAIA